jgi:protein TonB
MKRVINLIQGKRVLGKEASTGSGIQAQAQVINKARKANGQQPEAIVEALNIFQDTFFVAGKNFGSQALALPLAIFIHLLFAALLIGLPLMSGGSLPPVQVYSAFLAPVPSPTPPPAPPKGDGQAGSGKVQKVRRNTPVELGKLVVPVEIPENIAEEELTGQGGGFGVPWGVEYEKGENVWNKTLEELVSVPVGKEEEPVRAIGEIKPPRLLRRVEPEYPELARNAGVQGVVILEATTDIYGRVQNVRVLRSVPLLDQAAVEAVKQWIYEPMVINGRPRPVTFTVTIIFQLKK